MPPSPQELDNIGVFYERTASGAIPFADINLYFNRFRVKHIARSTRYLLRQTHVVGSARAARVGHVCSRTSTVTPTKGHTMSHAMPPAAKGASPWNQFINYLRASRITRASGGQPWRSDSLIGKDRLDLNSLIKLATQAENECSDDGSPSVSWALKCVAVPETRPGTKDGVDVLGVYLAFDGRAIRVTAVRAQSEKMPADVWDAGQYLGSIIVPGFYSLPKGLQQGARIKCSHQWLAWWS